MKDKTCEAVSIRKSGAIGFGVSARKAFGLDGGGSRLAVLWYDARGNRIGVELVGDPGEEDPESLFRMRVNKANGDILLDAHKFLDAHGIPHERAARYRAEWSSGHGMIVLDLDREE